MEEAKILGSPPPPLLRDGIPPGRRWWRCSGTEENGVWSLSGSDRVIHSLSSSLSMGRVAFILGEYLNASGRRASSKVRRKAFLITMTGYEGIV